VWIELIFFQIVFIGPNFLQLVFASLKFQNYLGQKK
jgi:hypothetical protein